MPDLRLQNHERRFVPGQEPGIASGNSFLTAKFPTGESYLEAWDLKIKGQSFSIQMAQGKNQLPTSVESQENYKTYIGYSLGCRSVGGQDIVCSSTTGWLVKRDDPFTQTNLLDSEEDQVQKLIFRIRTSLSIHYRKKLADRLTVLFDDAKEEDSATVGIAVGSLRNFYNFLQFHTNLKCPSVSLTPENNIYASWRADQNRVFSVHFLPNGDARFVIFKPNDRHPELQVRLSGTATSDVILETLAPSTMVDWILG